jgi:hypothetical protein
MSVRAPAAEREGGRGISGEFLDSVLHSGRLSNRRWKTPFPDRDFGPAQPEGRISFGLASFGSDRIGSTRLSLTD